MTKKHPTNKKTAAPAEPGPREAALLMRKNLAGLPTGLRIPFLHGFWEAMRYSCFSEQEKHGLRSNVHYMALQNEIEKELEEVSRTNAATARKASSRRRIHKAAD